MPRNRAQSHKRFPAFQRALGARIRKLRQQRGLSQLKLARTGHVALGHLSEVERGKLNVRVMTLVNIARALKIAVSDLCRGITLHGRQG